MGWDDDLIAWADALGEQDELHRLETVGDTHAMFHAHAGSVFCFKAGQLLAEQQPTRVHDAVVGVVELTAELLIGGFEIENGNGHAGDSEERWADEDREPGSDKFQFSGGK
jgi:hypothetical protein